MYLNVNIIFNSNVMNIFLPRTYTEIGSETENISRVDVSRDRLCLKHCLNEALRGVSKQYVLRRKNRCAYAYIIRKHLQKV